MEKKTFSLKSASTGKETLSWSKSLLNKLWSVWPACNIFNLVFWMNIVKLKLLFGVFKILTWHTSLPIRNMHIRTSEASCWELIPLRANQGRKVTTATVTLIVAMLDALSISALCHWSSATPFCSFLMHNILIMSECMYMTESVFNRFNVAAFSCTLLQGALSSWGHLRNR